MKKNTSTLKLILITVIGGIIAGVFVLHYEYSIFNKLVKSEIKKFDEKTYNKVEEIKNTDKKTTFSKKDEVINNNKSKNQKKEIDLQENEIKDKKINFPLVGSFQDKSLAINFAKSIINEGKNKYPVHVYYAGNNWYTVSLGGFLDRQEAKVRVIYAKKEEIADDAFVWTSTYMYIIDY